MVDADNESQKGQSDGPNLGELARADRAFYLKLVFLGGFLGLVKGPAVLFGLIVLPLFVWAFDGMQHHSLQSASKESRSAEINSQVLQWTLFVCVSQWSAAIAAAAVGHLYVDGFEEPWTSLTAFGVVGVTAIALTRSRVPYHPVVLWGSYVLLLALWSPWLLRDTCFPLVCRLVKAFQ